MTRSIKNIKREMDQSWEAYQRLLKKDAWYSQYKKQYVCFVGGKFVDSDRDEKTLLGRVRELYSGHPRMVTQVDRNPEVIDMPSDVTLA